MAYNPEVHHRRSIRLKGYDYSQVGLYFITLCCYQRKHLFGEIKDGKLLLNACGQIAFDEWLRTEDIRDNIRLHEFIIMPNHMHGIVEITFSKGKSTNQLYQASFKSPSQTIGAIIRGYKGATTKKIKILSAERGKKKDRGEDRDREEGRGIGEGKGATGKGELRFAPTEDASTIGSENKVWQRNYYEHIIRDERAYQNIANYIRTNPLRWKEDKFFRK
ncbi:MAG: transposase [Bacteroidota bacterium]